MVIHMIINQKTRTTMNGKIHIQLNIPLKKSHGVRLLLHSTTCLLTRLTKTPYIHVYQYINGIISLFSINSI